MARDIRGTRPYRKVRDQVIAEEPVCWLQLPGCTKRSTTADHHPIPFAQLAAHKMTGLERWNLRGACLNCNRKKGIRSRDQAKTGANRSNNRSNPATEFFSTESRSEIGRAHV